MTQGYTDLNSKLCWPYDFNGIKYIILYNNRSYPHFSIVGTTLTNVFSILHQKITVLWYRSGASCIYGHGFWKSLYYIILIHWSVWSSATFFINYVFKDPKWPFYHGCKQRKKPFPIVSFVQQCYLNWINMGFCCLCGITSKYFSYLSSVNLSRNMILYVIMLL